jgi:hypothetical protein
MKLGIGSFPVDIVDVKAAIKHGRLQVTFYRGNILLQDTQNGEAVKIGELPKEEKP